jgi:signal transduction histidine kinase
MNWLHSFRARIILGTFFWTLGLIPLLHLLFLLLHHETRMIPLWGVKVFFVFAAVFVSSGIWQFRVALRPFDQLRRQLSGLRDGSVSRIEGDYPNEVQPLVNDLNSLLENREKMVTRALAKAGDLAHGLKTPLAVLAQEADRAEAAGQLETACTISLQLDRMRRQVNYHLAQARAVTHGRVAGVRCSVLPSVEGLVRTLQRIYADRRLEIEVDVSPLHFVRGQREDLEEMLGNLLDNACKWSQSRIKIQSLQETDSVVLLVDDDGPGLPPSLRDVVLQRGVRADEAAPGSGLGLAIVRDLAELYQGSISLNDSPLGGLRATLRLPA